MDWKMILIVAVVIVGFFAFSRIGRTSSTEARQLVADGAKLIDVRTREEFAAGHIQGAVNIPVQELDRRMKEVGAKDAPIVLYCRSGARSSRAASMLKGAGYTKVHDIGPMSAW